MKSRLEIKHGQEYANEVREKWEVIQKLWKRKKPVGGSDNE